MCTKEFRLQNQLARYEQMLKSVGQLELTVCYQPGAGYDSIIDDERAAKVYYKHTGYKTIRVPFTFTGDAHDEVYFLLNRTTNTLIPIRDRSAIELVEGETLLTIDGKGTLTYR